MKTNIQFLYVLFVVIFGCGKSQDNITPIIEEKPIGEFIDDWTFRYFPKLGSNFDVAEFRMWTPNQNDQFTGILVLLQGFNTNAFGLTEDSEWRQFAINENLALVGVNFRTETSEYYYDAFQGSGNALIESIQQIAEKNNLNYMNELPFLLRGFSAGGVFSFYFSKFKPERVIAFSNLRGGVIIDSNNSNQKIPGLMLIGEHESTGQTILKRLLESEREKGALWSLAVEPNADHFFSLTSSDNLTKAFFSEVLSKRIQENSNELIQLNEAQGWLGNQDSKEIYSFQSYPYSKSSASWLVNEQFAILWKNFQEN